MKPFCVAVSRDECESIEGVRYPMAPTGETREIERLGRKMVGERVVVSLPRGPSLGWCSSVGEGYAIVWDSL